MIPVFPGALSKSKSVAADAIFKAQGFYVFRGPDRLRHCEKWLDMTHCMDVLRGLLFNLSIINLPACPKSPISVHT